MTIGVMINQGANANQIFALKGSDIATGMTSITTASRDVEVDDFFAIYKINDGGGTQFISIAESTANQHLRIETWGGAPDTANATTSVAAIMFMVGVHDGANADVDMAVNSNLVAFGEIDASNVIQVRFILKADDGELFLGLGGQSPTDFSSHNDVQLIADVENFRITGMNTTDYVAMAADGAYANLVAVGILGEVTEEEWNAGIRPLQSIQRTTHLLNGNARQAQGRLDALLDVLEEDPAFRAKMRVAMAARGLGHIARPELP